MKLNRKMITAKIRRDAGTYEVWAVDWLHQRVLVSRACGDEWIEMEKVTLSIDPCQDCLAVRRRAARRKA